MTVRLIYNLVLNVIWQSSSKRDMVKNIVLAADHKTNQFSLRISEKELFAELKRKSLFTQNYFLIEITLLYRG